MFWVILSLIGFVVGSCFLISDLNEFYFTWKVPVGVCFVLVSLFVCFYGLGAFNNVDLSSFADFFKPMNLDDPVVLMKC